MTTRSYMRRMRSAKYAERSLVTHPAGPLDLHGSVSDRVRRRSDSKALSLRMFKRVTTLDASMSLPVWAATPFVD